MIYRNFNFQVGVSAFMDLFKVSPESADAFVFLKHCTSDSEEFYNLLSKHAMRVFGIVYSVVKEVIHVYKNLFNIKYIVQYYLNRDIYKRNIFI